MRREPLGVIDIGSNSIRSLIVDPLPDGSYRVMDDEREMARLAARLGRDGRLSAAAMDRAVKALRRMTQIARSRGVERLSVVATSAIRAACNRRDFLDRVRRETGLRVRVISGNEEAQLAFESAALSFDLGDEPCAVADVGGGSTEVILALGSHVRRLSTLPLGAVALTEEFLKTDPVKGREFKSLRAEIRRRLERAGIAADPAPRFLIASGGTASTIAQIAMAMRGLIDRPAQGFEMTQAELRHLREALRRRSLAERRQMPGLSPERADIILAGACILYEVMDRLKVNVLKVSTRGIRHALLRRLIASRPGASRARHAPRQRLAAVEAFGRSLRFEQKHGEQVQRIALSLFDQLATPLQLGSDSRELLAAAALLHDVGYVVGFRQHHKHTYHLIAHAHLDGYTPTEREIIALVARYHRRSEPRRRHAAWSALPGRQRDLVTRLSALLRVADSLDRRHSQELREVRCRLDRRGLTIGLVSASDLTVEVHSAEEKVDLLRRLLDRKVRFEAVVPRASAASGDPSAGASRPRAESA